MKYFLYASVLFAIALVAVVLLVGAVRLLRRRPLLSERSWARTGVYVAISWALFVFCVLPVGLGFWVSRYMHTRTSEQGFEGPRFDRAGRWLTKDESGGRPMAPVHFDSEDGTRLRAFVVEPTSAAGPTPVATWIVVHGLFRSVYETETVASMLRSHGCRVLMLELRNHGGSGRGPATLGVDESRDVVAAAAWLRSNYDDVDAIALFGVSIGTAAVGLALDDVAPVAAVVFDAPIVELTKTAERSLSGGRHLRFPAVIQAALFGSMELWSGFDMDSVCTAPYLARLPEQTPVLIVSGGADHRAPVDEVEAFFEALPTAPERRKLWIRPGSKHGKVWIDDPAGYAERLGWIVEQLR